MVSLARSIEQNTDNKYIPKKFDYICRPIKIIPACHFGIISSVDDHGEITEIYEFTAQGIVQRIRFESFLQEAKWYVLFPSDLSNGDREGCEIRLKEKIRNFTGYNPAINNCESFVRDVLGENFISQVDMIKIITFISSYAQNFIDNTATKVILYGAAICGALSLRNCAGLIYKKHDNKFQMIADGRNLVNIIEGIDKFSYAIESIVNKFDEKTTNINTK